MFLDSFHLVGCSQPKIFHHSEAKISHSTADEEKNWPESRNESAQLAIFGALQKPFWQRHEKGKTLTIFSPFHLQAKSFHSFFGETFTFHN